MPQRDESLSKLASMGYHRLKHVPSQIYIGTHADYYNGVPGTKSIKAIKKHGLQSRLKGQFKGEQNRRDMVYVTTSPRLAETYAKLYSKPLVLEINTSKLPKSRFFSDPESPVPGLQLAYRGNIPASAICPLSILRLPSLGG